MNKYEPVSRQLCQWYTIAFKVSAFLALCQEWEIKIVRVENAKINPNNRYS